MTTHQKYLLEVSNAIGRLIQYYIETEHMKQDDAIRFAFTRIHSLEEMLLNDNEGPDAEV